MDRQGSDNGSGEEDEYGQSRSGVYRASHITSVPYNEGPPKGKSTPLCPYFSRTTLTDSLAGKSKEKRVLPSHMISDMSAGFSGSTPYGESTSGLSVTVDPSLSSGTARHLRQVEDYEEEHFTRMRGSKKESKKRRNEEEEVAFGGLGAGKGGKRRLGGFGAEFDDLLGDMAGSRASGAYEQMKGMKAKRPRVAGTGGVEKDESAGSSGLAGLQSSGGKRGKNAFDKAVVRAGKSAAGKKRTT
jgi:U3 small nucleolar ribonucleoprotein protein LCP5